MPVIGPKGRNRRGAIESVTNALITTNVLLNRIYNGKLFVASDLQTGVTSGDVSEYLIRTAATYVDFIFDIDADGDFEFELFEAPTTSADGSELSIINMNRNVTAAATVKVFQGPTVESGGDGTSLITRKVFGTTTAKKGSAISADIEPWLLKKNTDYLFRLTNRSGGAEDLSVRLQLSERADL